MNPRKGIPSSSLYVHLPFCSHRCDYCDFFSRAGVDPGLIRKILEAELRELDYLLDRYGPRRIPSLYLGGGTPSTVSPGLLGPFLRALLSRLPESPGEFTIEANPESLDSGFLDLALETGVSRISLGIQTFKASRLRQLGRGATPEDAQRALGLLEQRWPGELNLDLIYGLPGQTPQEALEDLERLIDVGAGHLSLYALSVEEGTALHRRVSRGEEKDVDPDQQEEIWETLHERLLLRGYIDYEISNYALPGKECRHNLGYWRMEPYMGLGPGGVSTLPGEAGLPVRLTKREDLEVYVKGPRDYLVEEISPGNFLVDYLLMGLRTREGIRRSSFRQIFGVSPEELFPHSLEEMRPLFISSDRRLSLSHRGRRFLNSVLLALMEELERDKPSISLSWPQENSS